MVVDQFVEHIRQGVRRQKNADFRDLGVVVQCVGLAGERGGEEEEQEVEEVFHGGKFGDFFGEWACMLLKLTEWLS